MNSRRLATAFSMTAREFLRRRGMLALILGVPVVGYVAIYAALPDATATLEAVENGVTVQVDLDQRDFFGGFQALSYVGLLASIIGLYLLQSALKADRRLILAGYSAFQLLTARLILLVVLDAALTAFLVGLTLLFMAPKQGAPYVLAVFWAALIYSLYGALTGVLVRSELGGIIAVLFLANIDIGYLQLPGFSNVLEEWWIKLLPGYFPAQLAIDAAFTSHLERLWPSLWVIPHSLVVASVMLSGYQRATHIHPFMPEEPKRPLLGIFLSILLGIAVGTSSMTAYWYYQQQPSVVEADGRLSAPHGHATSVLNGRVRTLEIAEGKQVQQDQVLGWVEDEATQLALPLRAPITGLVTSVPIRQGENVVQGNTIATIHQVDELEVVLEVEETSVTKVAIGQRVELSFSALGEIVVSQVREIAQEPLPPEQGVSERARRVRKYAVKVDLPGQDDRLRLGLAVHGRIFY